MSTVSDTIESERVSEKWDLGSDRGELSQPGRWRILDGLRGKRSRRGD